MEGTKVSNRVIPEGDRNCIWVDAGVVSYKLCDRDYECDKCPFDQIMRKNITREAGEKIGSSPRAPEEREDHPAREQTLSEFVDRLFASPLDTPFPNDRDYFENHLWVKECDGNVLRIGIDHCAAHFLNDIGDIILPQIDSVYNPNGPLVWLLSENGTVAVRSPLACKIKRNNPLLRESAGAIGKDPYETGWICDVALTVQSQWRRGTLNSVGNKARSEKQLAELKRDVVSRFESRLPAVGYTLPDGGARVKTLKDILGPMEYVSFLQRLL